MKVLKLDIDYKPPMEWRKMWLATRQTILRALNYNMLKIYEYETFRGLHYYIHLDRDVDAQTTNMLQFLLGDDHTRVKINAWRIGRGIKNWNKLFSKVLWRRRPKTITCLYCGNKIPLIKAKEKVLNEKR